MKSGWQAKTLGDVAVVQSGAGFPKKYQGQADREIPFYKVSDMNILGNEREMVYENNSITQEVRRELRAVLFPEGSTIFPKIGGAIATNKKRLTTCDCCVDNNVMGVIPKPGEIDSNFLFYFFLAHDLSEFANEAHLPSIRKTVVEAWPIFVPPLPEQQRIVGILDEAFEGIAAAKANAEKNLQNARALFESHLQSVFSKHGDGWAQRRLGEVAEFKNGLNYSKSSSGQTLPVVGVGDFQSNFYAPMEALQSATIDGQLADDYAIRRNDILTVRSNGSKRLVGRCMLVPEVNEVTSYSGFVIRIRFDTDQLLPRFLLHFLKSSGTRDRLTREGGGSNISNINQVKLSALPVLVPPLKRQEEIANTLDELSAETLRLVHLYQRKLVELEELKASLLHEAFTGQLGAQAA